MLQVLSIILTKISKLETLTYDDYKVLKSLYSKLSNTAYNQIVVNCIIYYNAEDTEEKIFLNDKIKTQLLIMKEGK